MFIYVEWCQRERTGWTARLTEIQVSTWLTEAYLELWRIEAGTEGHPLTAYYLRAWARAVGFGVARRRPRGRGPVETFYSHSYSTKNGRRRESRWLTRVPHPNGRTLGPSQSERHASGYSTARPPRLCHRPTVHQVVI